MIISWIWNALVWTIGDVLWIYSATYRLTSTYVLCLYPRVIGTTWEWRVLIALRVVFFLIIGHSWSLLDYQLWCFWLFIQWWESFTWWLICFLIFDYILILKEYKFDIFELWAVLSTFSNKGIHRTLLLWLLIVIAMIVFLILYALMVKHHIMVFISILEFLMIIMVLDFRQISVDCLVTQMSVDCCLVDSGKRLSLLSNWFIIIRRRLYWVI